MSLLGHASSSDTSDHHNPPCQVIGIGASAGGLQSLGRFLEQTRLGTGFAYVIMQHLSPNHKSYMDELLARNTKLPIRTPDDNEPLEADTVYIAPPGAQLTVHDGNFRVTKQHRQNETPHAIDLLFESLAECYGSQAVGVVLSGTGSDGSKGVRAIHAAGGRAFAESIDSAQFAGMPEASIATGCIDGVRDAKDLLVAIIGHEASDSEIPRDEEPPKQPPVKREGVDRIFDLLQNDHNLDFGHYKPGTVLRRIERRISMQNCRSIEGYVEKLEHNVAERNALYRDLLIGVTHFFRDEDAFAQLGEHVLPRIFDNANDDEQIRVWVAGCASGEEAYSVAILLSELSDERNRRGSFVVLATDVHEDSVAQASRGVYPEAALQGVSEERKERFFNQTNDSYRVADFLRQRVVFTRHDILKNAPFTKLDLVTCRNLLIYLDTDAQHRVLSFFHFGLKHKGYLWLGPSETLADFESEFSTVNGRWRMFQKRRNVQIPVDLRFTRELRKPKPVIGRLEKKESHEPEKAALFNRLLTDHMPASLLIDEAFQVLHLFGNVEPYVQLRKGSFSSKVDDLIIDSLKVPVAAAVQRAIREKTTVKYRNIPSYKEESGFLTLSVTPIPDEKSESNCYLIKFEPRVDASSLVERGIEYNATEVSNERVHSLERELRQSEENLQASNEELEASNEELQASNEELHASNEELQSTNEELQSVNEELHTVNAEYQNRIEDLTVLTNDMDHLVESTGVAMILLDGNLKIRKWTPLTSEMLGTEPDEVGLPIQHFAREIEIPRLVEDAEAALEGREVGEHEIMRDDGPTILLRTLPYRADGRIDGVIITLYDISNLSQIQHQLREALDRRDQFIAMVSHELRNPLGAIVNATELAKRELKQPEEGLRPLKTIARQVEQMSRLLDDLLDVSRLTSHKLELDSQVFDLAERVNDWAESASHLLKDIDFHLELPEEPVYVSGDTVRLQQVVMNLLSNATRFTPSGGSVCLRLSSDENDAVLQVQDTGIGIKAEDIDRIFDLFVQADRLMNKSESGLGIGLLLVKSVVGLHGGTVNVRSDGPGKGSTFEVRIPLSQDPLAKDFTSDSEECANVAPCQIVIVDDLPDNREMLAALLRLDGHEVFIASDGEQGLELIEKTQPDIAIVDIGLPILSGYDVAQRLRSDDRFESLFLIALTGYGQPDDQQRAFEAGFDQHILKPLNINKLRHTLAMTEARRRHRPRPNGTVENSTD